MGNVTSMDLRSRIVQAVEVEGMSRRGAAERFMVCPSTAIKLLKHKETTGGVAPKKIGGRLHNLEPHRDMLRAIVEETPDMTLERIANEVVAHSGLRAVIPRLPRSRLKAQNKKNHAKPASTARKTLLRCLTPVS